MNKNSVIFKGKNDGILILLDDKEDFADLKKTLESKVTSAKNFFKDANISITFGGRNLTEKEEVELLAIISKKSGINISYVNDTKNKTTNISPMTAVLKSVANKIPISNQKIADEPELEKSKNAKEKNEESLKASIFKTNKRPLDNLFDHIKSNSSLDAGENVTSYHKGSVRSGQELHFKGSIVIIGDVNPGAKIRAGGNVIVLGSLKGFANAGANGNGECFIAAINMHPSVIKIGEVVKYFPKEFADKKISPKYAYVQNGEICIQVLLNL